jgi:hypothetical protein
MPLDAPKPDDFIHFSQVSTFLKCRHKHDLAYIERLEPRARNNRMDFGTFGHAELADLWLGTKAHFPKAVAKAIAHAAPEAQLEVHDVAQTAQKVARKAFAQLEQRFQVVDMVTSLLVPEDRVPLVEHSLLIDVEGVKFGGTPDIVLREKADNSIWIVDWKFRQSVLPAESELLNLQMIVYVKLLKEHGVTVSGTRQIQIRPFLPKEPKVTKEGAISRQAIMTDWETYSAAVVKAGLDVADYQDMKAKLADTVFVDVDTCKTLRSERSSLAECRVLDAALIQCSAVDVHTVRSASKRPREATLNISSVPFSESRGKTMNRWSL